MAHGEVEGSNVVAIMMATEVNEPHHLFVIMINNNIIIQCS
jgi:hypothetical protein